MSLPLGAFLSGTKRLVDPDEPRAASDTITFGSLWERHRPIIIALPIAMAMSFFVWRSERPATVGPLPLRVWLGICLMGAAAPFTMFALALRVSERWPLFEESVWKTLRAHSVAVLIGVVISAIAEHVAGSRSPIPYTPLSIPFVILNGVGLYLVMILPIQGVRTLRDARKNAAAQARARVELAEAGRKRAEAELRALKAELNPHFLGNALQSVKALMRTDIDAANRVLVPLGDVLRDALSRVTLQETTLREEIASLEQFVEIERARLRGRLDIQFDIHPDALNVLVPDLILQPLVENAVKHGLVPFGGGCVRVTAAPSPNAPDKLRVVVEDDGVALGAVGTTRASPSGGVGLANIRARLAELYGNAASLELKRGGLGTCAVIDVPWHDADAGPEAVDLTSDDDLVQDARAVAAIPSFLADSWFGRLRRLAIMGGTVWAWYYWTQQNIQENVANALRRGLHDKAVYALVDGILCATFIVAAVHVAIRCARRWQFLVTSERIWRSARRPLIVAIACALVAGVSFVLMKIVLLLAFHYTELLDPGRLRFNVPRSVRGMVQTFLITWIAAQAYYATMRGQRARVRRTRLNEQLDDARRRRAEAELRALKSELNPHFIGNAFTAVSVLMRTDPPTASRIIDQLSDLLRAAVDRAGTQEVTLREELDSLKPFLDVERLRLGRELAVSLNVDEETLGGQVPHMILQPLVENAVKHGLVGRNGGRIEVGARRTPQFLELTIRDDGLGLADVGTAGLVDLPHRGGVGLANARARLAKLYGSSATLELADGPDGGAVARVMIPWHDGDIARLSPERRGTLHPVTSPASGAGVAGSP